MHANAARNGASEAPELEQPAACGPSMGSPASSGDDTEDVAEHTSPRTRRTRVSGWCVSPFWMWSVTERALTTVPARYVGAEW